MEELTLVPPKMYIKMMKARKQFVQLLVIVFFLFSSYFIFSQVPGDVLLFPVLGEEKILFIRVNYPDDPSVVLTDDRAQIHADSVAVIMAINSYGELTFSIDITPVLTMPQPKSFYELDNRLWFVRLRADAIKAAEEAGFAIGEYDREAIYTVQIWPQPYRGVGGFNNKTIMTKWANAVHTCHEFGHSFDWKHANFWRVSSSNPLDPGGEIIEYGDKFDIMGDFEHPHHFNPWFKWRASWLQSESIRTVTESGNYIVRGVELPPPQEPTNAYTALKIQRTPEMAFIVYYRSQEPLANTGALISMIPPSNSGPALLIDMMPNSQPADYKDAALLVGETLSDDLTGIEISLLDKNSDSLLVHINMPEETIDILPRINLVSPEPGLTISGEVNFEVTAYDPDIGNINGAGIDTVLFSLGYMEGNNPYIPGGNEFVEVDSHQLTTPPYIIKVGTDEFMDECYRLEIYAVSQNGKKNRAFFPLIIDNTGPSTPSSVVTKNEISKQIQLEQNVPNPFYQFTTIHYYLKSSGPAELSIYDLFGKKVKTLVQGNQYAGWHSIHWDGKYRQGLPMSNGLYLYKLQMGKFVETKKMLLWR